MTISISKNYTDKLFFDKGCTDMIKFVCCIMIAMHHYVQTYYKTSGSHNVFFDFFSSICGYLGVAVFFFLSGYGLMKSWQNKSLSFVTFLKRRLSKVYLPVVVISIIWGIILFFFASKFVLRPELSETLPAKNLLLGILSAFVLSCNDGALWFIKVILILYLLFYSYVSIVFPHQITKKYKANDCLAADCVNLSIGGGKCLIIIILLTTLVWVLLCWSMSVNFVISVPLFSIGILVAQFDSSVKRHFKVGMVLFMIAAVVSFAIFRHNAMFVHAWINYVAIAILISFSCLYDLTSCFFIYTLLLSNFFS